MMAKPNQAPDEFNMIDVGDELHVIDAMLTAVNNFNSFERTEYKVTHCGMLMIVATRIMQLKSNVDKYNKDSAN